MAITSGGLEPVLDSDESGKNSVFASALMSQLLENRSALTASQLFNSIRPSVIEKTASLGFDQLPELAPLYRAGHDGGDFVFKAPVSR